MDNVIAVMSSFNPDGEVLTNIKHNIQQLTTLIVVDDGSSNNQVLESLEDSNIQVVKLPSNQGIAAALNTGMSLALKQDVQYILFLDQDSKIEKHFVDNAVDVFKKYGAANKVGIVVPGKINGVPALPRYSLSSTVGLVPEAIQSGMVVSRECIESIGELDDRLFIDAVDTEFCLRATKNNWTIAARMDLNIEHSLGKSDRFNFFGLRPKKHSKRTEFNSHPPFRRYYITRNNIDIVLRYGATSPLWALRRTKAEIIQAFYAIVSGPHRFKNFLAILCGFAHGIVRKRGKISNSILQIIQ